LPNQSLLDTHRTSVHLITTTKYNNILSIEKEIAANLDNGEIIQAFWNMKKRQTGLRLNG
jgi:hypothetical protein